MLLLPSIITWRNATGPVVTIALSCAVFLIHWHVTTAPIAAPLFLLGVAFSAYRGGTASALISLAIVTAFGSIYYSLPGRPLVFTSHAFTRLLVVVAIGVFIAVTVSVLRQRSIRLLETERAARKAAEHASRESLTLRSALEQVDYGLVLLDSDLRAVFINRAYRKLWKLPDDVADRRPHFLELLNHGRDIGAYLVPPHEVEAYVAQRMATVRAGDERPVDLRLSDGQVTRVRGTALPGGGRMLSYGNVTDLVRHAEEQEALATTDPLTLTHNRRRFFEIADAAWEHFRRYGPQFSLLMVDIDHFKKINDRFGHDVGDRVLEHFADVCRKLKRESDVLARIGGEEFALLLPETQAQEAARFAERLRRAAAEPNPHARFTVSIGIAQATSEMADILELMKQADNALYAAKRSGRDRVALAGDDLQRQVA